MGPFDYVDPMTFNKGPIANDKESNEILKELGLPPLATRKRKKKAKKKGEEGDSGDDDDDDSGSDCDESDTPASKKARKSKTPAAARGRRKKDGTVKIEVPVEDSRDGIIMVYMLYTSTLSYE